MIDKNKRFVNTIFRKNSFLRLPADANPCIMKEKNHTQRMCRAVTEIRRYEGEEDSVPGFQAALCKIWRSGFDDSQEYFDFFFERKIKTKQGEVFYALNGPTIVGAAYLLHAGIRRAGAALEKAYYGYAFAILPEYRGKGIYAALAEEFCRFAAAQDAGILLCPENEKLLRYYTANGAVRNFMTEKAIFRKTDFMRLLAAGSVRELSPEEALLYEEIRNDAWKENDFLCWDGNAVKYALEENGSSGGFCKILEISGTRYLLFGRETEGKTVTLSETTLPPGFLLRSGAQLLEKPLVTYGIRPTPYGRAALLLD